MSEPFQSFSLQRYCFSSIPPNFSPNILKTERKTTPKVRTNVAVTKVTVIALIQQIITLHKHGERKFNRQCVADACPQIHHVGTFIGRTRLHFDVRIAKTSPPPIQSCIQAVHQFEVCLPVHIKHRRQIGTFQPLFPWRLVALNVQPMTGIHLDNIPIVIHKVGIQIEALVLREGCPRIFYALYWEPTRSSSDFLTGRSLH